MNGTTKVAFTQSTDSGNRRTTMIHSQAIFIIIGPQKLPVIDERKREHSPVHITNQDDQNQIRLQHSPPLLLQSPVELNHCKVHHYFCKVQKKGATDATTDKGWTSNAATTACPKRTHGTHRRQTVPTPRERTQRAQAVFGRCFKPLLDNMDIS